MESSLRLKYTRLIDLQQKLVPQRRRVNPDASGQLSYLMSQYIPSDETSRVLNVNTRQHIYELKGNVSNIVNLHRINDIRMVNKFFEAVNQRLPYNGIFIGCVETMDERKRRILNKFSKTVSYPYYALDFILKRIFPKTKITRKLYFYLTKGRNRVITSVETYGRLISCGFEILETIEINNLLYFVVKKVNEPKFDKEPTYGLLVKIRRVGKDGKVFRVYKFRTMHPYAEYLQSFVFKQNNLKEGGKFNNDFRITSWGKLMRKFWIDELPMLLNFFKGDLKLVGVRPLSPHYLSLYTPELREKRLKFKPGLFPPFYADLPKTLDEIMESENRYLDAHEKNPIKTDVIYFFKAFKNIVFKRARSS